MELKRKPDKEDLWKRYQGLASEIEGWFNDQASAACSAILSEQAAEAHVEDQAAGHRYIRSL